MVSCSGSFVEKRAATDSVAPTCRPCSRRVPSRRSTGAPSGGGVWAGVGGCCVGSAGAGVVSGKGGAAGGANSAGLGAGTGVGAGVGADGAGAVTAAVGTESIVVATLPLVAVTRKRMVEPTSACCGTYVVVAAPEMSLQSAPPASHRRHSCISVGAGEPDHVPSSPVSTDPTVGVPPMVGGVRLAGVTVYGVDVAAVPLGVVTVIGPLAALAGTVAVICPSELTA